MIVPAPNPEGPERPTNEPSRHIADTNDSRSVADALDALPDAVFITDRHGRLRFANRAALAMVNVSSESLLGRPLLFYVTKRTLKVMRHITRKLGAAGGDARFDLRIRARKHRPSVDCEAHARAEGEEIVWVLRERAPIVGAAPQDD